MMIGVYKITNIKSKRVYIGSSLSIKERWAMHRRELIKGTHHNYRMLADFKKHGLSSFGFQVLEELDNFTIRAELETVEQEYIDKYDSEQLYNIYGVVHKPFKKKVKPNPKKRKSKRIKIKPKRLRGLSKRDKKIQKRYDSLRD